MAQHWISMLGISMILTVIVISRPTFAYYKKCYEQPSMCFTAETKRPALQTLSSARNWCANNNASLAVVRDENVQHAIMKFIQDISSSISGDIILDASSSVTSNWKWINGNVPRNIPFGDDFSHYGYVTRRNDGRIDFGSDIGLAFMKRSFICSFNAGNSDCSNGIMLNGRCYKPYNDSLTWFDARSRCLEEHGDLATFETNFSASQISQKLVKGEYWIGLTKEIWNWANGTKMNYYNWEDDYPHPADGNCLCLKQSTGKWKNCPCDQSYRFVCIQDRTNNTDVESISDLTTTVLIATEAHHGTLMKSELVSSDMNNPAMFTGIGLGIVVLVIAAVAFLVFIVIQKRRSRTMNQWTKRAANGTGGHVENSIAERSESNDYTYSHLMFKNCNRESNIYETLQDPNYEDILF